MAGNPNDPNSIFGGGKFKGNDLSPTPNKDIFLRPKPESKGGGGGGGASKQTIEDARIAANNRAMDDEFKAQDKVKDPPPEAKPEVILSGPKWGAGQALFNQKITASVKGSIPEKISHVTKVTITAYATPPEGQRERIDAQDGHIKDGVAEVELTLWQPSAKGAKGKPLESCPYVFVAKHAYSQEITSEKLSVANRAFSLQTLRGVLETLEKEKGSDAVCIFIGTLNYKAVCDLARKGTIDNDPNKMPTRFFLLPGADDAKLEKLDPHPEEKNHQISVANLRTGLHALGYECASDGPFDQGLLDVFEKYLQSFPASEKSEMSTHKVQKGETLGGIALLFGLPGWQSLYAFNKAAIGNNPDLIKIGLELKIPTRNNTRGEQLLKEKGGDPKALIGVGQYCYPWVHFQLSLNDEGGSPIKLDKEYQVVLEDPESGKPIHSEKISGNGPYSIFLPHGKNVDLKINGFEVECENG